MAHLFRYRGLGYVALNVSDLDRTSIFAEKMFGLMPAGTGATGGRRFRCSQKVNDLILFQDASPGFRRAGWELESEEDVRLAFAHFEGLGLAPSPLDGADAQAFGLRKDASFSIRDPFSGGLLDFYAYMEEKSEAFVPTVAKIARLGHFALSVADAKAATGFFVDDLGFVVSDYVGDQQVNLLRAFPNPLHHTFGIGASRTGSAHLNHINFMVTDIDDIGRALYRFREHDVPICFGPGRHPTSDSIFIYALDPDGLTWEYSFGMELFPEQGARKARFMSALPADFDLWGARPTAEFASRGAIWRG